MSRMEKLIERQNKTLDAIEELSDRVSAEERDFNEDEQKTFDGLKLDAEEINRQIAREKELVELAKTRAKPVQPTQDPAPATGGKPNTPKRIKGALVVDMARAMFAGGGKSAYAAAQAAATMGLKEAAAVFKAVTNPADTVTAGWAAELMRDGYGDFIELLRPMSIYARAPSMSAVLGRNGKLLFPGLTTGVAGGWVGEGQPIPMAQGVFNEQELLPYKLGVITAQTRELMERSDPSSDAIIRDSMVRDTAIVLDTKFVSADAASAGVSPAGILNGVTPVDGTPAGAQSTIEELDAMFTAMITACLDANMDDNLVWIMNPGDVLKLSMRSTATGIYPYKDDLMSEMHLGYPVLKSNTQAAGTIILYHSGSMYKLVEGSIMVDSSADATVHTNTSPEQIVGGGGTPSIPAEGNVRSAFQEDSVYTRLVMPASYGVMRTDAVQAGNNYVL